MLRLALTATVFFSLAPAFASSEPNPIVFELFSSEGCASCPAGEEFLRQLTEKSTTGSAQVIGLEWHVDYWNDLGWADRFSSPAFAARQKTYAHFLHASVYTPQMVVNGSVEFVGSDASAAKRAVESAAKLTPIALKWVANGSVQIRSDASLQQDTFLLIVTERGLRSTVSRGENSGRVLVHGPIVRDVRIVTVDKDGAAQVEAPIPADAVRENVQVVILAHDSSGHVMGAGTLDTK